MNIMDKIRIKAKIHKLCNKIRKYNNKDEMVHIIKNALKQLPEEKKEASLDVCIKVVR